ncbi:MAG TPA: hypothetical protein VJ183_10785 [Chloroflexia bacterium]|nr:hypothetical protein [Chloroflexia bacterium]
MSKQFRIFGLLLTGMVLALAFALFTSTGKVAASPQSAPQASILAQACDPSGSVDGTAVPSTVLPGQVVTFTATRFTPGEEVSFWFTIPNGPIVGTAAPLCCADGQGVVMFEPEALPEAFYQFEGRWALTVKGATSNHTSVIYFCVLRQAQPTQPPPTATTAPPTATTVPPSPTTVVTSTVVESTPTSVATTPTTVATTPPTAVSTPPPATAPPLPTEEPVATAEPEPTVSVEPTVVGMPTTGQGDSTLLVILSLFGASLLGIGWMARRRSPGAAK